MADRLTDEAKAMFVMLALFATLSLVIAMIIVVVSVGA